MTQTQLAPAERVPRTEVADRIYRLGDRYVNWYVIEEAGRLTILDTGLPGHWEQLPALLAAIGRTLSDVDAVVLTHQHPDHLGVAERIRGAANVRVLIHPADADGARHGGRGEGSPSLRALLGAMVRASCRSYLASTARAGVLRVPPIAELATFVDGDRLDVPGRPRVIHTPGHSPGQCALHLEDRDVLFSGDALVTYDPGTGHVGPALLTPPFVMNQPQALASLKPLEGTGAAIVLTGHGEPWRNGVVEAVRLARIR